MIITWFTQPPGSNASYYQYDTVTEQFSRIRLELGRQGANNDTFVSYKPQRTVGFAEQRYSTTDPSAHWSVDQAGELCYDGTPLDSAPAPGYRVYDCSDVATFVHRGNPVTDAPILPEGILPRHLALLANEAMIDGARIALTPATATQEELIAAIQDTVCEILGVDTFAEATDAVILDKLRSQAAEISRAATGHHEAGLEDALAAAGEANDLIAEQIEDGVLTPTPEFEAAFADLQTAIAQAQAAGNGADVTQALSAIQSAHDAVEAALGSIDAARAEATATQLDAARDALAEAQRNASEWQDIEMEYEPLSEAATIEDYEAEIGIEYEREAMA